MLNIAIVEDELPALEKLKAQLSRSMYPRFVVYMSFSKGMFGIK